MAQKVNWPGIQEEFGSYSALHQADLHGHKKRWSLRSTSLQLLAYGAMVFECYYKSSSLGIKIPYSLSPHYNLRTKRGPDSQNFLLLKHPLPAKIFLFFFSVSV